MLQNGCERVQFLQRKVTFFICHHISTAVELTYHSIWEISTALSLENGAGTWSWLLQPFTYVVKTIKSLLQHLLYTGILKSLLLHTINFLLMAHLVFLSNYQPSRESKKSGINKPWTCYWISSTEWTFTISKLHYVLNKYISIKRLLSQFQKHHIPNFFNMSEHN